FTAYMAGLDLLFFVLGSLLRVFSAMSGPSATLGIWVSVLNFLLIILGCLLGLRWVRQHLMWRLRNRLIITYVFIGVIPVVLLVSMAGIASYLFAGQFATFLATADMQAELNKLDAENAIVTSDVAGELRAGR